MGQAEQVFQGAEINTNMVSDDETIAPVVLLHGVDDSCAGSGNSWADAISRGIDNRAVVKCVEIGNGKIASIFERMTW
jgi:hypothetical protein